MAVGVFLRNFFGALWSGLKGISRAITILVPLIAVGFFITAIVIGLRNGTPEPLPPRAALVVNPYGVLIEDRKPKDPLEALMASEGLGETYLFDVTRAIRRAADDERITVLVLDLQNLMAMSTSHGLEIKAAIDVFKASNKPVIATADWYAQHQYLLAAQADQVLLHPLGDVGVQGFGVYRSYIKQLLENVMVSMHVFRVGENKSAVEPYLRNDMSETERLVASRWINGLWQNYSDTVETERGLDAGSLTAMINEFPERLDAAKGNVAEMMLAAGLVDVLADHEESDLLIAEQVGATDDDGHFVGVGFMRYLSQTQPEAKPEGTPVVAIIPIEGELIPGESFSGMAGSDTVVAQLEQAAEMDNLSAIVLRINSPGGSVFASEVIRRRVLALKAEGFPVVVSMASVAASGGYYIAADADQIWAQPATVTGSIGVFAVFPTFEKLYDYVGVNVDGVGTTDRASSFRPDMPLDDSTSRIITSVIKHIYADFIGLVAEGRGMTPEAVDEIAGGKVWNGADAKGIGLVDELGGIDDAIEAAAALAGVDDWEGRIVGTPLSPEQLFLEALGRQLGVSALSVNSTTLRALWSTLARPLHALDALQDPKNMYMNCFECTAL